MLVVTWSIVAKTKSRWRVCVASVIIASMLGVIWSRIISTTVRGRRRPWVFADYGVVAATVGAHTLLPMIVGVTITE